MTKQPWAKGRVKGVRCVRLDSEVYELAKKQAVDRLMTIKDYIKHCVMYDAFFGKEKSD